MPLDAPAHGVRALRQLYREVRATYPQGQALFVGQDNWPVHQHPQVLAAAQEVGAEPMGLPTSSWLNPIELLWRKLCQRSLRARVHPT